MENNDICWIHFEQVRKLGVSERTFFFRKKKQQQRRQEKKTLVQFFFLLPTHLSVKKPAF